MSEKKLKWIIIVLLLLVLWRRKSGATAFADVGAGLAL